MTTIPTLHLNGTGNETLFNEYLHAHASILAAIQAVAQATCHGRDFYPQGDDAYSRARQEKDEVLRKLSEASTYAEDILRGIMDQQEARNS